MTARPTPEALVAALTAAGFTVAGSIPGIYIRMNWPDTRDGRPWSVLVPQNDTYADFNDLIDGTVGELRLVASIGRTAQTALDALGIEPTDPPHQPEQEAHHA